MRNSMVEIIVLVISFLGSTTNALTEHGPTNLINEHYSRVSHSVIDH